MIYYFIFGGMFAMVVAQIVLERRRTRDIDEVVSYSMHRIESLSDRVRAVDGTIDDTEARIIELEAKNDRERGQFLDGVTKTENRFREHERQIADLFVVNAELTTAVQQKSDRAELTSNIIRNDMGIETLEKGVEEQKAAIDAKLESIETLINHHRTSLILLRDGIQEAAERLIFNTDIEVDDDEETEEA